MLHPDIHWPPATSLLASGDDARVEAPTGVSLLGAHTFATSLTPHSARPTPAAVREALARYSTWSFAERVDLAELVSVHDCGDITEPDSAAGAAALHEALDPSAAKLWIVLGGDNALTWRAMGALARGRLDEWGLITLDAHLDMREGRSNGSPVRQLLDDGLSGAHVAQVGLADFSNSAPYARRAVDAGSTLIARHEVRAAGIVAAAQRALGVAGAGGRPIYVDIDMDVCDRGVVPGCPGAAPGGLSGDELRHFVRVVCTHPQVRAIDITEIDVERDAPDERTVRLGALAVLEAVTGYVRRKS